VVAPLSTALTVAGLALALLAGVLTALDRRIGRVLLAACGLVQLGLLGQLVVGIVSLATTDRAVSGPLFVGYLIGIQLVLPAAVAWARAEPSRWGTGVVVAAALVVTVLVARLNQVWTTGA
jgi:hypothetical protein